MKWTAFLLLLVFATPYCPAQVLDNAALLAKFDDATAAEARWILDSSFFATGAIGVAGDMPRAAYAFERLVRQRDVHNFELLTDSSNDVAVAYGIEGIQQLKPAILPGLLEKLVLRRGQFGTGSGGITSSSSICEVLFNAIEELERDRNLIGKAWLAFVNNVAQAGGSPLDRWIVRRFKAMLPELPPIKPEPAWWPYIQALLADDTEAVLRTLLAGNPESTSARLALDNLSNRRQPKVQTDVFADIWRRRRLSSESELDMLIHAAHWDRRASLLKADITAGRWVHIDEDLACGWTSLTTPDWEWLKKLKEPRARDAAERLRSNAIAGWRLDDGPPEDALDKQVWALFALREAGRAASPNARRAKLLLMDALEATPERMPVCRAFIDRKTAEDRLLEVYTTDQLVALSYRALGSSYPPTRLFGAQLVCALAIADPGDMTGFSSYKLRDSILERLWRACAEVRDCTTWDLRILALRIEQKLAKNPYTRGRRTDETATAWASELAREMASNPRAMPVTTKLDAFETDGLYYYAEGRAADLLDDIYNGGSEFLPVDERPTRPKDAAAPTAAEIYKRMQEASAKLEK
ncbi:MAG: hypothetical protein H6839_01310 [Planctomycetes bacterium]|nr:hypothetical protein [Planctomycetota bacterium]